jgi:hypothetical protein
VFFYRSPYDGRVFFDALGPPWPKHPCTDNPRIPVQRFSSQNWKPERFDWQMLGWEPVVIERIERIKDWARLKLRPSSLHPGFIVRAMPWRDEIAPGLPAHIKPLDAFGMGRISILHQTPAGERIVKSILTHRTLIACEVPVLGRARRGEADAVVQVADATFRAWEAKGSLPGTVRYPAFVDFRIAKLWVEKVAATGSETAKKTLRTHRAFRRSG